MSASDEPWTMGDTIALRELGWTLYDEERRQAPADHRPQTEAWVTDSGAMKVAEPGHEDRWMNSDYVMEVRD